MTAYTIEQMLPDIPRLYTALAEWLACVVCIVEQRQRFEKWKVCGILGLALPVQTVFLVLTKGQSGFLWFFYMAVALFFMYLLIWGCTDSNAPDAAYHCIRAFVMAEFAASLEWQLYCYGYYSCGFTRQWLSVFLLLGIYGVVYFILWKLGR